MTISELNKEKMTCRATNPIRSNVIGFVLAEAKSIAKTRGTEVTEGDFVASSVSWKKKLTKVLQENVSSEFQLRTEKEIEELSSFIPEPMSEDRTRLALIGIISTFPFDQQADRKGIMAIAKELPNVDMGTVNRVLTEILAGR